MRKKSVLNCVVGLWVGAMALNVGAVRVRENFDEDWKFQLGDPGRAQMPAFEDAQWRVLDLPHDWSAEAEFSKDNAGRNAWLPGGIGWYRKTFSVAAADENQRFELQFDGVYRHAQVWVNGTLLGKQFDGYTSFSYDISSQLRFGEKNTVAVRVDNSIQPNCRWYSGSGIYRHVWLTRTDPLHIENWSTAITTPAITDSEAHVRVRLNVENGRHQWANCVVETVVRDPAGKTVAQTETTKTLGLGQVFEVDQLLSVFSPMRWSVDAPNRYTAISRVKVGGQVVDSCTTPFGIREIRFDAKKGFFLNGQNMKFKGVCLHHEAGTVGAAVPERVWERRLENLKAIGCNAIRTAHNPPAPEFLDLCDRMGFLVMDEFVDKWVHEVRPNADPLNDPAFAEPHFETEWKKNFRTNVRRDRNHPSVVMWSVGNENNPPGHPEEYRRMKLYGDFVRSIDSTRPVISGMERGLDKDPEEKVDDILQSCEPMDLIALNYGEQWCTRIGHRNPGKPYVSTESYRYFNSTETTRFTAIERSPWLDVMENDHNTGLFLWVGIDYLGEKHRKNSWPGIGSNGGLLDFAGFRKPISYLYEAFWSDKPMVYVDVYKNAPDYTKPGRWSSPEMYAHWNHAKGAELNLVTYSNCEFVELYLNGRKLGRKKASDFSNWIMKWRDVSYEAGTLRAVGIQDGKAVCEYELKTAGAPVAFALAADARTVAPEGIVHVEISLKDSAGLAVKHEDRALTFTVEGGEILGLDHGQLTGNDLLSEKKNRSTRNGRCLAILRAGQAGEPLKLTVTARGMSAAVLNIAVK